MYRLIIWLSLGMVLAVAWLWVDSNSARREYDFGRGGYTCALISQAGTATVRIFRNDPEDEYMKELRLPYWLMFLGVVGAGAAADTVLWAFRKGRQGRGFPVEQGS